MKLRWDIFAVFETESPEIGGAASISPHVFQLFRLERFDEISKRTGHPNLRAARPAYDVVAAEFYALGAKMCRRCFDIGDLQLNTIPTARCRLRAIGHGLPSDASWTTFLDKPTSGFLPPTPPVAYLFLVRNSSPRRGFSRGRDESPYFFGHIIIANFLFHGVDREVQ